MELKVFEKDEVIFYEGEYQSCMYDIHSGKVAIYANFGKKNEVLLTELAPGKLFGEMGMVEAKVRSATAVAVEKTEVYQINNDTFSDYFRDQPEKVIAILQNMSGRLRELSGEYLDACKTISEYVEAEKNNKPKEQSLLDKIKKIIGIAEELDVKYAEYYNSVYTYDSMHGFYY